MQLEAAEIEARDLTLGDDPLEGTIVELIVAACDTSEDLWEIADHLDDLVASGRATVDALA